MDIGLNIDIENIIQQAIDIRASDIHFEPHKENIIVRFRVDGILRVAQTVPATFRDNIISRIKIMSKMNIADKRYPQDGHLEYQYNNIFYNIRISSLPAIYGENIVMRILNQSNIIMKLTQSGLDEEQLSQVYRLISAPEGIIIITGPTGSGKTNLLYSSTFRFREIFLQYP